jgi:hypothetical protein
MKKKAVAVLLVAEQCYLCSFDGLLPTSYDLVHAKEQAVCAGTAGHDLVRLLCGAHVLSLLVFFFLDLFVFVLDTYVLLPLQ